MGKFLTADEKAKLNHSEMETDQNNICFEDLHRWKLWHRDRGEDSFSDEEKKRLVAAISDWFGMFVRRPRDVAVAKPNEYIAFIIECAEESQLTVVAVLQCLETLLKSSKWLPSIAEVNDAFAKLFEEANSFRRLCLGVSHQFVVTSREALRYISQAEVSIRQFIPDFPEASEIEKAWCQFFEDAPFGVVPWASFLDDFNKSADEIKAGLKAGGYWPATPLLNLYIAAQIPIDKQDAALDFILHRRDESPGNSVCDLPKDWIDAVAEAPKLLSGKDVDGDLAVHLIDQLGVQYRDATNAYWESQNEFTEGDGRGEFDD